ncbi:cysteine hydrolase family protein [Xenorhabdus innexi]|uniref:2,3-dihydro-2,3-dihydroxybenzoate synthetase, isochroismatase n=1 Tax=Xenorhabdus innexi TaxID=290109 RepID=A0A1N6MUI0_9GAMM|nr:isochorismatase family cysteine hydrolase [Xenorhabdus innexi]PHM35855.1 2,3-dihydro-2,3-dihydroxybenzoate synthetase, isochroismatase [Xenorhabdus innexi]SIP72533.1 conserved hypothetical protein [Xenorhabdus innexi]
MKALIVIDMLNDFVTGVLANEANVIPIVPVIQKMINYARSKSDWLVVYSNDSHWENDREMAIWGRHAMRGTFGANVIDALAPIGAKREIVSPKRFYGAFDGTNLDAVFKQYGVTEVILTGQHTDCCVRHTAYGAFVRGYEMKVLSDAVCVFLEPDQNKALNYLQSIYGVEITTSTELGVYIP